MTKAQKQYVITRTTSRSTSESGPLTLEQAIEYYAYTLECGRAYAHEKGNKKINCSPKTIKSLITNLNNAVNNAAANGYAGVYYTAEQVTQP